MKHLRKRDLSKELLVEQALKLSPSERFQYALGLAEWALQANPDLIKNRTYLLARHERPMKHRG